MSSKAWGRALKVALLSKPQNRSIADKVRSAGINSYFENFKCSEFHRSTSEFQVLLRVSRLAPKNLKFSQNFKIAIFARVTLNVIFL